MKLVAAILLTLFSGALAATEMLPETWDGIWRGEIEVQVGEKVEHRATMELRVARLPAANAKSWIIQYSGQPLRDYEIRSVAGEAGHFVTDEKNGTLLNEELIGDTLHSVFSVGDVLLTSRFENRGEEIGVEITTFAIPPVSVDHRSSERAVSYPFRSVQRGILKKQKTTPQPYDCP